MHETENLVTISIPTSTAEILMHASQGIRSLLLFGFGRLWLKYKMNQGMAN